MVKPSAKEYRELIRALLALRNDDEARRFLRDLLTEPELAEFSRRWQAARLLAQAVPYTEVEKRTGLSSATVARVAKWLNTGRGGYQLIIKRLHHRHSISPPIGKRVS